jgi:hypothetical protein
MIVIIIIIIMIIITVHLKDKSVIHYDINYNCMYHHDTANHQMIFHILMQVFLKLYVFSKL